MEELIIISYLNDFIFCPVSIYFHQVYGKRDKMTYLGESQINGLIAHSSIDNKVYSSKSNILLGMDVFSSRYNLVGKIDIFDIEKAELVERKYKVSEIYDGYVFQLYAQFFALCDMGYSVKSLKIHSISDNKSYKVKLPEEDPLMLSQFHSLLNDINIFDLYSFNQSNKNKCSKCIYEPACDRSK